MSDRLLHKIQYNQETALKYGWKPEWFGASDFDNELLMKIRQWQEKHEGVAPDGLVGSKTYRRIWTEREADIDDYEPQIVVPKDNNYIVCNGNFYDIDWDRVILWTEDDGLECGYGQFTSYAGEVPRKITQFVNHWDVCLSSRSCAKVLKKRGISVHFCIGNDGIIYQTMDCQHAAWHAGDRTVNRLSVGVEISNAYYTKYQDWYIKKGYGPRPVITDAKVHGTTLEPHLGFYPVQLEALAALWRALHKAVDISLTIPLEDGKMVTTMKEGFGSGKLEGFFNHYNVTKKKIDCAGLDLVNVLNAAKE